MRLFTRSFEERKKRRYRLIAGVLEGLGVTATAITTAITTVKLLLVGTAKAAAVVAISIAIIAAMRRPREDLDWKIVYRAKTRTLR